MWRRAGGGPVGVTGGPQGTRPETDAELEERVVPDQGRTLRPPPLSLSLPCGWAGLSVLPAPGSSGEDRRLTWSPSRLFISEAARK